MHGVVSYLGSVCRSDVWQKIICAIPAVCFKLDPSIPSRRYRCVRIAEILSIVGLILVLPERTYLTTINCRYSAVSFLVYDYASGNNANEVTIYTNNGVPVGRV